MADLTAGAVIVKHRCANPACMKLLRIADRPLSPQEREVARDEKPYLYVEAQQRTEGELEGLLVFNCPACRFVHVLGLREDRPEQAESRS